MGLNHTNKLYEFANIYNPYRLLCFKSGYVMLKQCQDKRSNLFGYSPFERRVIEKDMSS